jgi:hypothetical protein
MMALVDCSGSSRNSSLSVMPMRPNQSRDRQGAPRGVGNRVVLTTRRNP